MTTTTKDFTLGQVLSVTTSRLVCPMGDLYGIMDYLTGDSLSTIGLLSAAKPCTDALLKQHPQLADVDASGVDATNWRAWLDEQEAKFGPTLSVMPMATWEKRGLADDIIDVMRLNPNAEVMVVEP